MFKESCDNKEQTKINKTMSKLKNIITDSLFEGLNKINIELSADNFFKLSNRLLKDIEKQFSLNVVVASKRDETLELLEEIITKIKKADSEVENGIYDPMLECAKNILNNYVIKRR